MGWCIKGVLQSIGMVNGSVGNDFTLGRFGLTFQCIIYLFLLQRTLISRSAECTRGGASIAPNSLRIRKSFYNQRGSVDSCP